MAAAIYTPDEERRYGLKALPDIPFMGSPAAERLNAAYEESRKAYRRAHPHLTRDDIASRGGA